MIARENGNILPQKSVVAEFDNNFNAQILNEYVEGEKELGLEGETATEVEGTRFRAKEKSLDTDAGELRSNAKASTISSEVLANLAQLKEIYKKTDRTNRTKGSINLKGHNYISVRIPDMEYFLI